MLAHPTSILARWPKGPSCAKLLMLSLFFVLYTANLKGPISNSGNGLLTAHKVVNHRVDGAVEVAQPVGHERGRYRVIVLCQLDGISMDAKMLI